MTRTAVRVAAGRILRVAGAATLVGAFVMGPSGRAGADSAGPQYTGWWSATEQLPVAVPAPTVPDGGLLVQQGANGPTAYGAVHYAGVPAGTGTLLLDVATGSTASVGTIEACATTQPWTATKGPGAWAARPSYGTACNPGIAATDGSAVAFSVSIPAGGSGVLDLAIVPTGSSLPFSATFNKPSAKSLNVSTIEAPPPPVAPSAAAPDQTPAVQATPDIPATAPSDVPADTSPAPVAPPPAAVVPPTQTVQLALAPPATGSGRTDDKRAQRIAAVAGLLALVVGWWLVGARPQRSPQLLGALADGGAVATGDLAGGPAGVVTMAGIGRFVRPRYSRPRRLL